MALINYTEPVDPATLFIGIGVLILFLTIAYILYRFYLSFISALDISMDRDKKYALIESITLDKIAAKKGINLEKELLKHKIFDPLKSKSVKKRIKDEVFKELFGLDKKNKEELMESE